MPALHDDVGLIQEVEGHKVLQAQDENLFSTCDWRNCELPRILPCDVLTRERFLY